MNLAPLTGIKIYKRSGRYMTALWNMKVDGVLRASHDQEEADAMLRRPVVSGINNVRRNNVPERVHGHLPWAV
jgi:hypothetical protein